MSNYTEVNKQQITLAHLLCVSFRNAGGMRQPRSRQFGTESNLREDAGGWHQKIGMLLTAVHCAITCY